MDSAVAFVTRGLGHEVFLTADGFTWMPDQTGHAVRMTIRGARREVRIAGVDEQAARVHYFRGSDPAKWRTNVPTFARARYQEVYPGIDLVYYGHPGGLEYDFTVAPGADPGAITLAFEGMTNLSIDRFGDLILDTPAGRIVQRKPHVYQEGGGGVLRVVASEYLLRGHNEVGLALGPYDRGRRLVIDPVLAYSTFLGGSGGTYGEQAYGVAVDEFQNVYVAGKTLSTTFPVGEGSPANNDLFVVKLTPAGALAFVAVVNGNGSDSGEAIAVDGQGNILVTGFTDSTDFPTLNPIRGNQASRDALLLKLDPSGVLVYSTYLGGSSSFDYGEAVAADAAGNAYVAGATQSSDFPVLNALQPARQGQDAFVLKVDPAGNLLYGTFLGGSAAEAAESIAVDSAGRFSVTGWTSSSNFPRVLSSQPKQAGDDVFVSQYTPDGTGFVYSRYLGGSSHDRAFAVALDGTGGVFVGGYTDSSNFPAVNPVHLDQPGPDAFLTRLDSGGVVTFSTHLGGTGWERLLGLSVRDGYVYATGQTFSIDWPVLDAVQPAKAGDASTGDAFVVAVHVASSGLMYSTYLGGGTTDEGRGTAALPGRNVFVAGWTESVDFPTVRPIQNFKSNRGNVFIARLAPVGVDSVSPSWVQTAGEDTITVTGRYFAAGATVLVGGVAASNVSVLDDTTLIATTPPLSAGTVDVVVANPDGGSGTLYGGVTVLNGTGPAAHAGPDQFVEAVDRSGTPVTLDGSGSFDPDNEPLTYEWRDESNTVIGTGAIVTALLPFGEHTITLIVSDGHSTPGIDAVVVTITDTTRPTVAVVTPNGSNRIYTATPTLIEWTALDSGSGIASFDVYVSADGGGTYNPIPGCGNLSAAARSCTWAAPAPATTKARVRVDARDVAGNLGADSSNANFLIIAGSAWVKVTSPNTNVNWGAGSTQQIRWSHNLGSAAFVRLEASFDGGASWALIAASVKNSGSSAGSFYWTLPNVLTSAARIRVSWNNGPVTDTGDVNFTIATPFVKVTAPTAGTNWGYGTTRKQTWTTNLGPLDRVAVLLSTDGGATFPVQLTAAATATARSSTFTTPTLAGSTASARTRVVWSNAPPGFAAQATSPVNFRVEPPFVTVAAPNGGESWSLGTTRSVVWSQNLGNLEHVRIELSQDDGASYPIVVLASTVSDGSQSVAVSSSWATPAARVRVTWIDSAAVTDTSNASFVIQ